MGTSKRAQRNWGMVVTFFWGPMLIASMVIESRAQTPMKVSVGLGGEQANGDSRSSHLSADGRFVAFRSAASNLVEGDENGSEDDVFVYDRQTGTMTRISVEPQEGEVMRSTDVEDISADGRFLALHSSPTESPDGPPSGRQDVFLYDRQEETMTQVSMGMVGVAPNGGSGSDEISADGRYLTFHSDASNLVEGDGNEHSDIFVYDRMLGTITRVSVNTEGGDPNGDSFSADISGDGRYVGFDSFASNLVADDENGELDSFVYDRQTGTTIRLAAGLEESEGSMRRSGGSNLNTNGRYVAFGSCPVNFEDPFPCGSFLYDQLTGTTTQVPGSGDLSDDGRFIEFDKGGDSFGEMDVFVYDRESGVTEKVSVFPGEDSDGFNESSQISRNGRYVTFTHSTDPFGFDPNEFSDVYVVDRGPASIADPDLQDPNGDGIADLIWRNTTSGATAVWLMNTSGLLDSATFPGSVGLEWVIRGVGDVTGDGPADVVWRNTNSGEVAIWHMNSSGTLQSATFPGGASADWTIHDVGDLNHDGYADLLWRNANSGTVAVWLMNQDGLREEATFPGGVGPKWVIQGVGDVNGNGTADIVWRNANNGEMATWLMNEDGLLEAATFPGGAPLAWVIQGVGDVNGDGVADVVWRHTDNGEMAVWVMNFAGMRQGATFPGGAGPEWVIQQVGDVNGDSRADLIWRNSNTGATAVWVMNSEGLREDATFPGGAGHEWQLRP